MQDQLLRISGVKAATGYGRSSIYRLISLNRFPRPLRLAGGGVVAWRASEIQAWIDQQPRTEPAAKSERRELEAA